MNSWWRHQMETFSALLAICAGNSPVPGEFPSQRPVTRSFDVFFDNSLILINDWVKNREAGDLRRYRTHYDVIVMDMELLTIGPLGTNFSVIFIKTQWFSYKNMHLQMSATSRPFCSQWVKLYEWHFVEDKHRFTWYVISLATLYSFIVFPCH